MDYITYGMTPLSKAAASLYGGFFLNGLLKNELALLKSESGINFLLIPGYT